MSLTISLSRRLFLLKSILGLAFIAGVLLSSKLWLSTRLYPLVPVVDAIGPIAAPWDQILLGLWLICLGIFTLLPRQRAFGYASLAIGLFLAVQDQSRWQPWFFQYMVMLLLLLRRASDNDGLLVDLRFLMAGIYFWSGLHKLSITFVASVFPQLLAPLQSWLPEGVYAVLRPWGYAVPFLEAAMGLGILIPRFQKPMLALVIGMHAFILLSLGPWGNHSNIVVWPWNGAMICFGLLLFGRSQQIPWPMALASALRRPSFWFVVVLFWAAPALDFLNLWDSNLSSNLYSGVYNSLRIHFPPGEGQRLPKGLDPYLELKPDGERVLYAFDWSYEELQVPPHDEVRIFRGVMRQICAWEQDSPSITFVIEKPPHWKTGHRSEAKFQCNGL